MPGRRPVPREEAHAEGLPVPQNLQLEIARFGAIGPREEPGTTYSYSNAGYNTLAALVEIVSKQPFKVYVRKAIYEPLGMTDSCNHEPDANSARMSAIFRRRGPSRAFKLGWKPGDPPDYPFPRGSGGMISTARDYAVFCQAYLDGGTCGGRRILTRPLVAAATRSHTSGIPEATPYGFGWVVSPADHTISHGGSDGTWGWVDPARNLIGLVFTQSPGGPNPRDWFRKLVTDACEDSR